MEIGELDGEEIARLARLRSRSIAKPTALDQEVLGSELAMRGGTCLHKLHLP